MRLHFGSQPRLRTPNDNPQLFLATRCPVNTLAVGRRPEIRLFEPELLRDLCPENGLSAAIDHDKQLATSPSPVHGALRSAICKPGQQKKRLGVTASSKQQRPINYTCAQPCCRPGARKLEKVAFRCVERQGSPLVRVNMNERPGWRRAVVTIHGYAESPAYSPGRGELTLAGCRAVLFGRRPDRAGSWMVTRGICHGTGREVESRQRLSEFPDRGAFGNVLLPSPAACPDSPSARTGRPAGTRMSRTSIREIPARGLNSSRSRTPSSTGFSLPGTFTVSGAEGRRGLRCEFPS